MGSLKDQLLKSGLVNKKQSQRAAAEQQKLQHRAKKDSQVAASLEKQKSKELDEIFTQKEERRLIDLELNKKRDQLLAERENYYRCVQLVRSQGMQPADSDQFYFFREGQKIRKIPILSWHREWIVRGKLAIVKSPDFEVEEFSLIPKLAAEKVRELLPQCVLVFYSEISDNEDLKESHMEEAQ